MKADSLQMVKVFSSGGDIHYILPHFQREYAWGETDMFRCQGCGGIEARSEAVSEVFLIDGTPVLVEGIPAVVCARCGDATFSRATNERVRRMVHGETRPVRSVRADVFAYA